MSLTRTILLVEDNEDDIFAMRRALKLARITNPLQTVTDGEKALDYFAGKDGYSNRGMFPLPFIVFLDLKLPFIDGFEVLKWIRQQPQLKQVGVVVLTSSAEKKDHERAYALGARTYMVKPPSSEMVLDVMKSLGSLWLSNSASLPVSVEP